MKEDIEKVKNKNLINSEEIKFDHLQSLIILLVKVVGPAILVITGLILLALRIAGWSLVFGLPVTIIGVVLLVFVYDDILTRKLSHTHHDLNSDNKSIVEEE